MLARGARRSRDAGERARRLSAKALPRGPGRARAEGLGARVGGRSSDSWTPGVPTGPTGRRFPGPERAQCCVTAVVSTHRCGAVPDSHRVPSCLAAPSGGSGEPLTGETLHVVEGCG
ncbi:hypothetical protein APASM_3187 [Actinosynnema pretiosum subsp. pretiosum]|nr:hypothetical protein APASM_3187 [Actinosynnema pretiosum subsp. pretiosum]